jgi:hypothetical protein
MEVSSEYASLGNRLWNFTGRGLNIRIAEILVVYLIMLSQLHSLTRGTSLWKLY